MSRTGRRDRRQPIFDPDLYVAATDALERLRAAGLRPKQYNIASPYGHRLSRPDRDEDEEFTDDR